MHVIFQQLGQLFLGSVPTMVLFLLLVFCYTRLVDRPMRRTLAERRERTVGAREKAAAAVEEAEAKTREYGERLRAARLEIVQGRERQVAAWNTGREKVLTETRETVQARVRDARAVVEADVERSRAAMDPAIDALAAQILTAVLPAETRA